MSRRVTKQLDNIFEHISKDSPENASAMIRRILESIDALELFPSRQRVESEKKGRIPVRSLPVAEYMVFFEVHEQNRAVKILRVAHGARRRPKKYG